MASRKQKLGFNLFPVVCLQVCLAMAALAAGCRSREDRPADDEPTAKASSSDVDASFCDGDSGLPSATAPVAVPDNGDLGRLAPSPTDTCNEGDPASEPSFLQEVWKRALERLGPQDPTKPPSRNACETAEVLQRIGVTEAEAILRRCPRPESRRVVPPSPAHSGLPQRVHHEQAHRREAAAEVPRVLGRAAVATVAATDEWICA